MPMPDVVQAQQQRQEGDRKEGSGSGVPLPLQSGPGSESEEGSCDHEPTPALDMSPDVHRPGLAKNRCQ